MSKKRQKNIVESQKDLMQESNATAMFSTIKNENFSQLSDAFVKDIRAKDVNNNEKSV